MDKNREKTANDHAEAWERRIDQVCAALSGLEPKTELDLLSEILIQRAETLGFRVNVFGPVRRGEVQ